MTLLQAVTEGSNIDLRLLVLAVFGVLEVAVRLTPSEKDNSIVNKVIKFGTMALDILIPNRGKGGERLGLFKKKNNV
jgi:hypothetical protein